MEGRDDRAAAPAPESRRRRRRHRLVDVERGRTAPARGRARMRKIERGLRMMFGSDPFAGTITERPIGITSARRLAVAAEPGVEDPREAARRVVAHHEPDVDGRALRSAAAWSSACSTTAPQNDHEYGTTIPTFISHNYPRPATLYARMTLARLVPLALVALLAASCSGNDKKSSATTTATTTTTRRDRLELGRAPAPGRRPRRRRVAWRSASAISTRCSPGASPATSRSRSARPRPRSCRSPGSTASGPAGTRAQRVLVKIDLNGKRPPRLQNGQQVSFVGRFAKAPKRWRQPGREGQDGPAVAHEAGRLHHRPDRQAEAAVEPWAAGSCSGSAAC